VVVVIVALAVVIFLILGWEPAITETGIRILSAFIFISIISGIAEYTTTKQGLK
jgi:hypothetical protein